MPSHNFSAATDKGLHRGNNEDSYLSSPELGLWLVADGMGGHEAGEVASAIVVETVQQSTKVGNTLVDAIQESHEAVLKAATEGVGAEGMGSTVVALKSDDLEYQIAWVGDSRAYLWTPDNTGGTLEQLSTDHSYVQLLLESGAIAEHEAVSHPDKNIITQCIGSQDLGELRVDSVRGQWQEKQWILLCSDGLTDELNDEAIAQILFVSRSLRGAVDNLLRQALNRGGRDNVTVQIIESPQAPISPLQGLSDWLPRIVGNRVWDGVISVAALLAFSFLCYWLLT